MNSTQVISNDPEALLAFTVYTIKNLLNYTNATPTNGHCTLKRPLPPLPHFIRELYTVSSKTSSNCHDYLTCSVKLFALIYLYRLKSKLPKNARGGPDTPYRLILAALLTSSKYLSETGTGLTSMHLSQLTQSLFTAKDINQMERSFLGLLRYDLWVSASDVQFFMHLYGHTLQIDVYHVNLLPAAATATAASQRLYSNNHLKSHSHSSTMQPSSTSVSIAAAAPTASSIAYGNTSNQSVIVDTTSATTTTNNSTATATAISPHHA